MLKISRVSAILLVLLIGVSSAFAITLYTLVIPMQFRKPTYAYVVTRVQYSDYPKVYIESTYSVSGFTYPSQPSTLRFSVYNSGSATRYITLEVKILETSQTLFTITNSKLLGMTRYEPTVSFTSPSEFGSYTIQIKMVNIT
jgi:hypothetical protein